MLHLIEGKFMRYSACGSTPGSLPRLRVTPTPTPTTQSCLQFQCDLGHIPHRFQRPKAHLLCCTSAIPRWLSILPKRGPMGQEYVGHWGLIGPCVGPQLPLSTLYGHAHPSSVCVVLRWQDSEKLAPLFDAMFHTPTSGGSLPMSCPCRATRFGPTRALLTAYGVRH